MVVRASEWTILMRSATPSTRLGYQGATQDASDVYCICRSCGSLHYGLHKWVRLGVVVVAVWRTMCMQSLRVYISPKKRGRTEVDRR